jgi:hypothetical protein
MFNLARNISRLTILKGVNTNGQLRMEQLQIKGLQKAEYSDFRIFAKFETLNIP